MPAQTFSLTLSDPDATAHFAAELASVLSLGDVILLEGGVGAGKTHVARALIQSVLTTPEDVPSPTFTLVQTYQTTLGEVWHADLYRLSAIQEIEELGLTDAFETAICLVEWPDRLGRLKPDHGLSLSLADGPDPYARRVNATWTDAKWHARLAKWTQ